MEIIKFKDKYFELIEEKWVDSCEGCYFHCTYEKNEDYFDECSKLFSKCSRNSKKIFREMELWEVLFAGEKNIESII